MAVTKQDTRDQASPNVSVENMPDQESVPVEKVEQEQGVPVAEKPEKTLITEQKDVSKEKEKIKETEKKVDEGEGPGKSAPPSPPPSKMMTDEELVADLRHVMSLEKPKQVKVLVYLAFKKGIHHAFNIARKLKDPYLLDEFHDTMVDELYDLLVKKKKIKTYKK